MISVSEALRVIEENLAPLGEESVALDCALGRTLSAELVADRDFPPFDTSAMDGYAVESTGALPLLRAARESVAAGGAMPPRIDPGEAVRVMTGAPVPPNTAAIVPVEDCLVEGGMVRIAKPVRPGANRRARGEIYRRGETLLAASSRLTPEAIVLCAAAGLDPVSVFARPRAAVLVTGAEIVSARADPSPTQIRNSNGPAIRAAFARRGIEADELPPVRDDLELLEPIFTRAVGRYDLLVTTGGVSAGDFDLTPDAAKRAGFEILFHRVAVKPGKPIALGRNGTTFWFGLPGNPVSALTTFEIFVAAALNRFEGRAAAPASVRAVLTRGVTEKGGRAAFLDARVTAVDGRLQIEPIEGRGSHDVKSQSRRNALLMVPPEGGTFEAGDVVSAILLQDPTA